MTPANPDAEHAVLGAILAPEEEAKMALNPQLARQFLKTLYDPFFSQTAGTAHLEVRGKREREGMTFRRFYPNLEALLDAMPTWDPARNYWVGVALRRDTQGGTKKDLLAITAIFGDVDCGTAGHKEVTKYQNKEEALAAIEDFPLRPTILIDSGGGYQPYWVLREPMELNNGNIAHLERINRGLAFALEGDVAATDAARILRLPGTFNMKLVDNPRPVKIIWCEPDRLYNLAELCKYEEKPQGHRQAPQRKTAARLQEKGGHAAYAQAAFEKELAGLAQAREGDRNTRLNHAAFALGQFIGAGILDRGSVDAALYGVAVSIGLGDSEIRGTVRSGIEAGMENPRELPEKKPRATRGRDKASKRGNSALRRFLTQLDIQATYERECSLKVTDPRPNAEGWITCYSLYRPGTQTPTAFINIGKGELRGYYREFDEHGQPWLSVNLCKAISDTGSGPYMTPKDVYAHLLKTAEAAPGLDPVMSPLDELQKTTAVPKECGHYYTVSKNCHSLVVIVGEGDVECKPLCNFTAQITDEITRDDGLMVTKEFIISGNGTDLTLPPAKVPTKDFDALKWARKEWGAAASITPVRNNAAHLPNAILSHSRGLGINRQTLYAHTGWREIKGVWRYLHGDGGIGPGEPVAVDLGKNLHRYRLPEPGGIKEAQASLRFLDIGPWEVTAPLMACTYLAPFADLLKIDFSLWLHGPTGAMKSTLAALALAHYGDFSRLTLPGSWFSTVNSLEKLCFVLKDCLVVIDDFAPAASAKDAHKMSENAGRLIYQAGNRSGRGRLTSDLSARPDHYPRCLIISTGEMLLPGQRGSATASYLGVEIDPKKSPIDRGRLTAAQAEAHLYAGAMAAYLGDLAPRLDEVQDDLRALFEAYREAFQNGGHARIPEIQSWLAVGFEFFLNFQVRMGAVPEDEAYQMSKRAWKVFEALGEKHSRIIQGERPTLKFLAILGELFTQGKIYVESATMADAPPAKGNDLGWVGTNPNRGAEMIGWADDERLYLIPEMTYRVVAETVSRQGDFLALGKNEMLSALTRDGLIEPPKEGNVKVKSIHGASKRVIVLPKVNLFRDEDLEIEK